MYIKQSNSIKSTMSLYQSTVALFYLVSLIVSVSSFTFIVPTEDTEVADIPKVESTIYNIIMSAFLQRVKIDDIDSVDTEEDTIRVKKELEKFRKVSSMPVPKLLHLVVMMFKNMIYDEATKGEKSLTPQQAANHLANIFKLKITEFDGLNSEKKKPKGDFP